MESIAQNIILFFKSKENLKNLLFIAFNLAFWVIIFAIMLINGYASGSIFKYDAFYDHHWAFISYLGGMAANGILPGIDFYSPHSVFVPLVLGGFFKILGISQISLGIAVSVMNFISMFFMYKTARFVMPNLFAKLAVLTLLLSHLGRDLPWYNDVAMAFLSMGIYFFASYLKNPQNYKLIIVGLVCFTLPYLRQQGIVACVVMLILPTILFYLNAIDRDFYKEMAKKILLTFVAVNAAFWAFILVRNGFEGLEILFSSLTSLVDMAQPTIGYENKISDIAIKLFLYTSYGTDWHGFVMQNLLYWFIVIIPCIYFVYRPIDKRLDKQFQQFAHISKEDSIRFITATLVLSTIIFNYPVNEEARLKVQFGLGIWLFIDALRLCFYRKEHIKTSLIFIAIVFLLLHTEKIMQFYDRFSQNVEKISTTRSGEVKMPSDTPFAGMKFRIEYANTLENALYTLRNYQRETNKAIIFDGELVEINSYLFLLFSNENIALQHKFPYYYGSFDRGEFFTQMNEKFSDFVESNKPIVIGCSGTPKMEGYKILVALNNKCNIFVPDNTIGDTKPQNATNHDLKERK